MADEPVIPAAPLAPAPAAPAAAPVPAPAVESVPAAPVAAPIAAPVEAPKIEAAPVAAENPAEPKTEAKPADTKPAIELPKPEASLLSEAGKEPVEAKPEGETPAEVAPVEAPLATFDAFTLPEGMTLDEKELGNFTTMLGEMERDTKADHRVVQEYGQKLLDKYLEQRIQDAKIQMQTWVDTRKGWQNEVKNDPIYGRNRFETALRDAARVRDMFASDRFKEMIEYTGAGDHPGMMDFVHNIAKFLDKHGLLREGRPVAAPPSSTPAKRGPRSRYQQPGA